MMNVIYCRCGRYRAEVRVDEIRVMELVPGLPVVAMWVDPPVGCLQRWIQDNHYGCTWQPDVTTVREEVG